MGVSPRVGPLGRVGRIGALVAVLGVIVLVASSCAVGIETSATLVADTSARLSGRVANTSQQNTTYWFEYGTTTDYGTTTPPKTVTAGPSTKPAVNEAITGLQEATTYHYRLCAKGSDGQGTCSYDAELTTTSGRDSVTGSGTVLALPGLGFALGADIDARSDPGGANPTGQATIGPGTAYFKTADTGPVTCLNVVGNRATIGMLALPADLGQDPPPVAYHRLLFIEDNAAPGRDRYGTRVVADATTCPPPTEADFPDFVLADMPLPPTITAGNFVVHDHTP